MGKRTHPGSVPQCGRNGPGHLWCRSSRREALQYPGKQTLFPAVCPHSRLPSQSPAAQRRQTHPLFGQTGRRHPAYDETHPPPRVAGIKKQPGAFAGLPRNNDDVIVYQILILSSGAIHIASPSLMSNASYHAWMFLNAPFTRHLPNECTSVLVLRRISCGRTFCAQRFA